MDDDTPGGTPPFGLGEITLADKPLFDRAFAGLVEPLSDYTFANSFIWGTSLRLYWRVTESHLCVFANGTGDLTMLMPPLPLPGATDAELARALHAGFDTMDAYNAARGVTAHHSRIEYVCDELLDRIASLPGPGLSATPMGGDYVYDMARMVDLAGGPLKSKRKARARFTRDFPDHRTEPYEDRHRDACLDLLDRWRHHGDATHEGEVADGQVGSDILRDRDRHATARALDHHAALGLTGMVLVVGDRLIGFTFGERLSPTHVSILIEKTDPGYTGAPQFIFSEFCRLCWADATECNAGDDWGIPTLRFTKQSYRPIRLLSKSVLTRQPAVVTTDQPVEVPAVAPPHRVAASDPAPADAEPVTLRRATADDAAAVLALEAACFDRLEETFNRRQVRGLIDCPRAAVTVAEHAGRVVGWSVGLIRRHRRTSTGRLYALAVHADARGRGLGRLLARRTLTELAALGAERVFLEARADNAAAIALYQSLGFTRRRPLPNYYAPGRHAVSMAATLAVPAPVSDPLPAGRLTTRHFSR